MNRRYEDARALQARLDEVRAEFEAKAAQGLLDAFNCYMYLNT